MQITPGLLEKYYHGRCTPYEIEQVEAWMVSDAEDNADTEEVKDEQSLKESIWMPLERLVQQDVQLKRPAGLFRLSRRAIVKYTVAAGILVCFSTLGYNVIFDKAKQPVQVLLSNTDVMNVMRKDVGDLLITALPNTEVKFSSPAKGKVAGEVNFCNAVMIRNVGANDIVLRFAQNCRDEETITKDFLCKKEVDYLAIYLKGDVCSVGQQFLWVEKDKLKLIPPDEKIRQLAQQLNNIEKQLPAGS
ncbi:MAG: hypothetical protein KF862_09200 [Chitinophagaceae bacterium]|nr:hypothetical protein [Chitinophagaceae bacterium]